MNARAAVVRGGAGFIGSHLVRGLLEHGYAVTVFDNFSTGLRENLGQAAGSVRVVEGDARDLAALRQTIKGADVVFHLAADVSVPLSVDDPAFVHEVNATGTPRFKGRVAADDERGE